MGRKPMTEEEKAAKKAEREEKQQVAETKVQETVADNAAKQGEKTYSEDDVKILLEQAVGKAVQEALAAQPQVIRVSADAPIVKMMFQDTCATDNFIQFGTNGKFGAITGQYGKLNVTKEAFLGEFRDSMVQDLLARRKLIVLDGLTDEERVAYGVSYKPNEIMPEEIFRNMLDYPERLIEMYSALCPSYREMVAVQFSTAYEKNDPRVMQNRDLVVKLNKLSKKDYADLPADDIRRNGAFYQIVKGLNAKENE